MVRMMESTRSFCLKDFLVLSGSIGTNNRRPMLRPEIVSIPPGISCGRLVSDRSMINTSLDNSGLIMAALPRRNIRTDNIISLRNSHGFNMISSANYCYRRRENNSSTIRLARANSSPDDQGDHYPSKSMGISYVLGHVLAGILGFLIKFPKVLLGFLLKEKSVIGEIEEEVEHATEVAEDVAKKVKEVAETTEEISERIEGESSEDGAIHKAAELVDNISHEVAKNAGTVENVAERISETVKTVDVDVESAIDEVEDLAGMFSGDKTQDASKGTDSSPPTVKTKNPTMKHSVDVNGADNATKLME
eukprot:Gb_20463 [translate_table: standard]